MALNHPNIVRCVECFTSNNKLCIVMDYCSEGVCCVCVLCKWQAPVCFCLYLSECVYFSSHCCQQ